MDWVKALFWISFAIIFYAFVGYGIFIYLVVQGKRISSRKANQADRFFEPTVTIVIPSYNEATVLAGKIVNTLSLQYPAEKLTVIIAADGSTNESLSVVEKFKGVRYMHQVLPAGKTAAEDRAMNFVETPFVFFTDANTMVKPRSPETYDQAFYR